MKLLIKTMMDMCQLSAAAVIVMTITLPCIQVLQKFVTGRIITVMVKLMNEIWIKTDLYQLSAAVMTVMIMILIHIQVLKRCVTGKITTVMVK